MKVLALVVLIIAISGLEAGVVKREVPNIPSIAEITETLKSFSDTIRVKAEDLIAKIQTPEIQAQYNTYLEQAKTHMDPVRSQLEKWLNEMTELVNKNS